MAIIAGLVLPRGPGSSWFLTRTERQFATERIQRDTADYIKHEYGEDGIEKDRLSRRDFKEAAKDWKFYGIIIFNICASVPTQAFSVFLPLVLQGLGYSSIRANLVCKLRPPKAVITANSSIADDRATICLWCCWSIYVCFELRPPVRRHGTPPISAPINMQA